jgi:hypothetical protein
MIVETCRRPRGKLSPIRGATAASTPQSRQPTRRKSTLFWNEYIPDECADSSARTASPAARRPHRQPRQPRQPHQHHPAPPSGPHPAPPPRTTRPRGNKRRPLPEVTVAANAVYPTELRSQDGTSSQRMGSRRSGWEVGRLADWELRPRGTSPVSRARCPSCLTAA